MGTDKEIKALAEAYCAARMRLKNRKKRAAEAEKVLSDSRKKLEGWVAAREDWSPEDLLFRQAALETAKALVMLQNANSNLDGNEKDMKELEKAVSDAWKALVAAQGWPKDVVEIPD